MSKTKVLIFDADKCTGCRICELVCSMINHGEYNPYKSRIRLIRNKVMEVNIITLDATCDGACNRCVENCPMEALEFVCVEEAAIIRGKEPKMGKFPAPLFSKE